MTGPSPRQAELLRFVFEFNSKHGMCPTRKEIADGLGVSSPHGVQLHLKALQRKGLISWHPLLSRALRITPAGFDAIERAIMAHDA